MEMLRLLVDLLIKDESEYLDFKEKFHSSNVRLIHDILCLANAYSESDRYLIYGVKDDKTISGIESDPNGKTNAEIQDLLRQSNFNRIPTISLTNFDNIQGHTIALLIIKTRPDKPFYITKDKTEGKDTLRAGVIYTRLGDTNIPLRETAPEDHIELMWRERFGIDLDPLTRVLRMIEPKELWIQSDSESYLYHQTLS